MKRIYPGELRGWPAVGLAAVVLCLLVVVAFFIVGVALMLNLLL